MAFFNDESNQSSSSYSGLRMPWSDSAYRSVVDMVPQNLDFAFNRIKKQIDSPVPQLNSNGFFDSQMEGVNVFGRNLFNNISSNYANRGLLAPDNVAGVIGSAVREAAPTLMGQISQNMLIPEQIKQNRFGSLINTLGLVPGFLGGQSTSSGSSSGTNVLSSWATPEGLKAAGSAFGGVSSMFCWIAEAIYGKDALETHVARWYVNTVLPFSEAGQAFRAWYGKHGRRVAELVLVSPILRAILKPTFDMFVYKALKG